MQVDGTRNGKGIMWFQKGDIYFGGLFIWYNGYTLKYKKVD